MLRITGLHQIFHPGEVNEVHALRGIELTLPTSQFVTLIGSNGAGKSTLFNVIAGVYGPTQGTIVIDDVDVTAWPEPKRATLIGRVFQDPLSGTAASMTIAQNLTLALLRDQRRDVARAARAVRRDKKRPLDRQALHRRELRIRPRRDAPDLLAGPAPRTAHRRRIFIQLT